MPDFWEFPTVSMGLGADHGHLPGPLQPLSATTAASRTPRSSTSGASSATAKPTSPKRSAPSRWPSREELDNLIFVINCNLQRLDGPVRGNGKIIQELEAAFRGAGWNVIKVIWGSDWDPLLAQRQDRPARQAHGRGRRRRISEIHRRAGRLHPRAFLRQVSRAAASWSSTCPTSSCASCRRGGHDPEKVYAAYKAAVEHKGSPTVILAKTIKGYGLGEAGEGRNITHQQKKLNEEELQRIPHPLRHSDLRRGSARSALLQAGRRQPGDAISARAAQGAGRLSARAHGRMPAAAKSPPLEHFKRLLQGQRRPRSLDDDGLRRPAAASCCRTRRSASRSCRSSPTRRAPSAWKRCSSQCGIYSNVGQLYEPVDAKTLLYYREAKDGQILEEGITEAGSMSSFIAAGTAYATHGITDDSVLHLLLDVRLPAHRRPDLGRRRHARAAASCWAAPPAAPRSTGEGLQHQDGHSHIAGLDGAEPARPTIRPSPTRLADHRQDGMRRMYEEGERRLLLHHARQRKLPDAADARGRRPRASSAACTSSGPQSLKEPKAKSKVHLLGSGADPARGAAAQEILAENTAWRPTSGA